MTVTWERLGEGRLELESECEPPNESQDEHQMRKPSGGVVEDSQELPKKSYKELRESLIEDWMKNG